MSEPDANATRQEPPTIGEGVWHDKVLVDAVGYTKGLVAILDSLTEGFQRRGQELEELRHRLTILQSERRSILDGRADVDAQVAGLTAERDELRATLEERERELETLRHEVAQGGPPPVAEASPRAGSDPGAADPARQVEELREVVRSLERQLQRAGHVPGRTPSAQGGWGSATPSDAQAARADLSGLEELVSDQPPVQARDVAGLTAERDELRATLEERERELETLRHEVAQGQAALDAHTREIQALRVGMAETVRQAEEIRKVLEGLEQEREATAHRQAVLEAELEAERRRVRETTARASQEQIALREDLADAENLLAEARKDIAASHGLVASLRRTVEEERTRNAQLHDQLKSPEPSRRGGRIEAVAALLGEIGRTLGGSTDASSTAASEWAELEALVQDSGAEAQPDRAALAVLQPLVDALRDLWPPADRAEGGAAGPAAEDATVRRHAAQIADRWRQVLRERAAPSDVGGSADAKEGRRDARPAPARERRPSPGEGGRGGKTEPAPTPSASAAPRQKPSRRRGAPAGATVECMLVATGKEEARILRGEISRINSMGLLGAFDERFPEGRQVVVRFVREGEVVSCLGRIVRALESPAADDPAGVCNHLIRFESNPMASGDELDTFAS